MGTRGQGNAVGRNRAIRWAESEMDRPLDITGPLDRLTRTAVAFHILKANGSTQKAADSLGRSVRWVQMRLKEYQR